MANNLMQLVTSQNPSNDKSLSGTMKYVLTKFLQHVDDRLPAKVIAFNRTTNMATVQPMIAHLLTDGTALPRDPINVPVDQLGGHGLILNFDLVPGDLGYIKANDRDISLFRQLWAVVTPNTARKHDFSDGTFIPTVMNGFTINAVDSGRAVLQAVDGTIRLSIGAGTVVISDTTAYPANTHAVLDVQSTTKAFIFPRMTTSQKNTISAVPGMAVFDTTTNQLSIYNGSWS